MRERLRTWIWGELPGRCLWVGRVGKPKPPLAPSGEMGTAQLLGHPWNKRALMTLAVVRKEQCKLNTLYGKRELSSLCSADFRLYKVSGSKAGTGSPWLAHRWAGQCWTWELQPPERHRSIHWAQGTAGAGLHGGSHCDWQQFVFLKDSSSWCLVHSCRPVTPLTWAGKIHIGTAPLRGFFLWWGQHEGCLESVLMHRLKRERA